MLKILNFKKEYQDHLILDIPTLTIPNGVSWFQGVNGSGKSTFFKAISGIIPFEGEVVFNQSLSLVSEPITFRKIINYSFAEPRFPDYLSGKEIIDYYVNIYGGERTEAERLIKLFGIANFYETAISTYSSGMLKKISLISVFIGSPKILALDEPLTTIDKESQAILLAILADKVKEGVNLLIASHHALPECDLAVNHHFQVDDKTIVSQA